MEKFRYRADIDGLRAIAVLSVLSFHFGIDSFSGGFVGVDIFFVISGFLITRLIKEQILAGSFSLSEFYLRRARRLFPALFFTLTMCFAGAYRFFFAEHFERFGGALLYALLSISNVYFWNEQGYFDTESIFKPLLHTWSLGVEEQFYLIWPTLLLIFFAVRIKFFVLIGIGLVGVLSLYAAQFYLANDASAVFFLTPFRMIEFACGAVTVWLVDIKTNHWVLLEILLFSGLLLIGYAIFSFDAHTVFPGINALIPCVGTVLVIYAGQARFAGKLLSNPLAVGIGLISYSVYLIHWPIYVFYQYPVSHPLDTIEILALFVATLFLATLQFLYIETPFRHLKFAKDQFNASTFGIGCALLALAMTLPAAHVWKHDGWPWRSDQPLTMINIPDVQSELNKRYVYVNINRDCIGKISANCTSADTVDGLVIGNSHAIDGFNAMMIATKGKHQLSMLAQGGCNPVQDPEHTIPVKWPSREKCITLNKRWFNPGTYDGFDYLVVSSKFGIYYQADELKEYLMFIKSQTQIKKVIVLGNFIELKQKLYSIIQNGTKLHESVRTFLQSAFIYNNESRQICKEMGCLFVDKRHLFCNNHGLEACKLEHNGVPFTWDKDHLSLEFSVWLGRLASPQINDYLDRK